MRGETVDYGIKLLQILASIVILGSELHGISGQLHALTSSPPVLIE
jgi:hypothetical protein